MSVTIEPEPSESERAAILDALGSSEAEGPGEWVEAALLEGVESCELDP